MAKITVIGSFVMDNVARMEEFPQAGQTVLGQSVDKYPGGKGINQCVAAARLGGDTEMIGMLGRDENGKIFRDILESEKIACGAVFYSEKPTAVAQVQIDKTGQNRICVIPSANFEFGLKELDLIEERLRRTEIVVLQLELTQAVTEEIICRARAYGVKILLNPAPAVKLKREILGLVDYITPNETELSVLTGMPVETEDEVKRAARELLSYGVGNVISTLGGRGALIANEVGEELVEGYRVNVVDTVAAGDSFNGALAVALTEGKTLREAVRFANGMGALTVQGKGAIPSLRSRRELENFLALQGKK